MRLGDLDALKEAYFNAINETSIGEVSIIDIIDNAPTVEAPQVVLFAEDMTEEEKQKLIAEIKAVMDNAKFTIESAN